MKPLETGYSQDIHGQISLLRGGLWRIDSSLPNFTPQLLHYGCKNNVVQFYIPGHYRDFL